MIEYSARGFIDINSSGYPILCKKKDDRNQSVNLIEDIKNFILANKEVGSYADKEDVISLGGEIHKIPNCNIMIWFSRGEKTIDEVRNSLTHILYGGDYSVDVDYEGYSEFTITDYCLNEFTIGGHNLRQIFENKRGKYCNFVLEAYVPVLGLTCYNKCEIKQMIKLPSGVEVNARELLEVIEDLTDSSSLVIYNKDIEKFLMNLDYIHYDGCSYSSVSAKSDEKMDELYNQIYNMVYGD